MDNARIQELPIGLAHESDTFRPGNPLPGLLDSVPSVFQASISEPAFDTLNLSYCIWLRSDSGDWHTGEVSNPIPESADPDGSFEFMAILDGYPSAYRAWAADYYETDLDLADVAAVYCGGSLTQRLVKSLNPHVELEEIQQDIERIGYQ